LDFDCLINWCLTPTLAVFQLYRGMSWILNQSEKIQYNFKIL